MGITLPQEHVHIYVHLVQILGSYFIGVILTRALVYLTQILRRCKYLKVWGKLLESNIYASDIWVKLYETSQFHSDNFTPDTFTFNPNTMKISNGTKNIAKQTNNDLD